MDKQLRADLRAKLLDAMERRSRVEQQIQAHADNIRDVRRERGNPYFFHPKPADDPESAAKYTGYASHDPGLQLMRDWERVQQEVTDLLTRLSGVESSSY